MPLLQKKITHQSVLNGQPEEYFGVITNVSRWYLWNPNILHANLDGEFVTGANGSCMPHDYTYTAIKIGEVIKNRKVELVFLVPGGSVIIHYEFNLVGHNETHVRRDAYLNGLFAFVRFIIYKKVMLRHYEETLRAFESQVMLMRSQPVAQHRA